MTEDNIIVKIEVKKANNKNKDLKLKYLEFTNNCIYYFKVLIPFVE